MAAARENAVEKVSLHANALALGECGLLIRGEPGSGKSSLTFALISRAGETGRFGRLVGDDRVEIECHNGRLIARGHPAAQGMIELRGQGIATQPFEPAVVLSHVVDLLPAAAMPRYPEPEGMEAKICGVKLPRLASPIGRSSYDCALSVLAWLSRSETI